jgi:hypothetical protein
MKKICSFILIMSIASMFSFGQGADTSKVKKFGISFTGFVKAECAFDTRQVEQSREAMLVFYPLNQSLDKNGKDINAHPALNQYAMATRLIGTITGPNAFGAKAMAYMEADFTGPSSVENNAFRLRHAYIRLTWAKSELLMGQYWHPMNVPEMIPYVISLNTGAPFHPFSRQPQVRFTKSFGKINLVAVASSERDYTSTGPSGATSEYLRNSAIPNLHLQLQYKNGDKFFCGMAGDYRRITPRLKTDSMLVADESLDCFAATVFAKIKLDKLTIKIQSVLGQNMYEHLMMGGYAVEKIDTATGNITYTNLAQFTCWTDVSTNSKKFNAAIFLGFAKNLGSLHNIWGAYYARGKNIDIAYRIAPRFTWTSGNVTLASEFEYTTAAYGTNGWLGDVTDTKSFYNLRVLLAAIYNF